MPLRGSFLFRGETGMAVGKTFLVSDLHTVDDLNGLRNVVVAYVAKSTVSFDPRGCRRVGVCNVGTRDSHTNSRESFLTFLGHIDVDEDIASTNITK